MTPLRLLVELKLLPYRESSLRQSGRNLNEYNDENYQNSLADIFCIVGASEWS